MAKSITPAVLAAELGVSDSAVRRWLRDEVDRGGDTGPWLIDDDLAARVRARFTTTAEARASRPAECTVDGCDRAAHGLGWCRAHYQRWNRTGSTGGIGAGGQQRAKTHCPNGHPYDEENTIVYPSDGRRRCLTCRRGGRGRTPSSA